VFQGLHGGGGRVLVKQIGGISLNTKNGGRHWGGKGATVKQRRGEAASC